MNLYNQINELMKNNILKENQKITLCYTSEFGLLDVIQTRFFFCEEKPKYMNCPKEEYITRIYNIPRGKRNMRINNISNISNVVIYDGFKTIDSDELNYIKTFKDNLKIFESRYTAFDKNVFYNLVEKYPDYLFKSI